MSQPHSQPEPAPTPRPMRSAAPNRPRPIAPRAISKEAPGPISRTSAARTGATAKDAAATARPVARHHDDLARHQQLERLGRQVGLDPSFVGHHPLPRQPMLCHPDGARPWILARLHDDPVIQRDRRLPIPAATRESLCELSHHWSAPLSVVLAHELDQGPTPSGPLAAADLLAAPAEPISLEKSMRLTPPTRPTTQTLEAVERVERTAQAAMTGMATAAMVGGAAVVGVAALPLLAVALIDVDPILFAVIPPGQGNGHPAWFELARWEA